MASQKNNHVAWQTISSQLVFEAEPWVKVSVSQVCLPDGRMVDDYYQVRLLDYAGVIAQTVDGRIILERQYKHGVGRPNLVLPGGAINPGEDPLEAAQRELLEETGYIAEEWQNLGSFVSDANQLGSIAHLSLARQARQIAEPDSGDLEEIEIVLMTPEEVVKAVHEGEVVVLGTIAGLALALSPIFSQGQIKHKETKP